MFDVTITSADLVRELTAADRIVAKKITIPVLANVLLEPRDGSVQVSATDIDLQLRGACKATVALIDQTPVTLPARRLLDLMRQLPNTEVRLVEKGNGVSVSSAGFRATLATWPAEDFPTLQTPPTDVTGVMLERGALQRAIQRVRFATAPADARYYLNGALLSVEGGVATLVASDAHRLSVAEWPCEGALAPLLIPKRTLDALHGMLDGEGENVEVRAGANHIFFTIGGRALVSRMIDGKFPNWRAFVPKTSPPLAEGEVALALSATRRMQVVTDGIQRRTVFALDPSLLTMSASTASVGDGEAEMPVAYEGPAVKVAMNVTYVQDFLEVIGTDTFSVAMQDESTPVVWRSIGGGESYTYLVIPMRL